MRNLAINGDHHIELVDHRRRIGNVGETGGKIDDLVAEPGQRGGRSGRIEREQANGGNGK